MKMIYAVICVMVLLLNISCSMDNSDIKNSGASTGDTSGNINQSGKPPVFKLEKAWETGRDFRVAESVQYDKTRNRIYVTNIDGQPMGRDGKGFITIMDTAGRIVTPDWINGMDAPKGMGIMRNMLYVTDIDKLVEIDIEKGMIVKKYSIPGASFLNDIAAADDGTLYISDMESNCIYKFKDGKAEKWLDIGRPNSVLFESGRLFIGSMAEKAVYEVNISDKTKRIAAKNDSGIDGLKMYKEGMFIASDWAGKTNLIDRQGVISMLLNTTAAEIQSADLEFVRELNLLLIPTFFDDRVAAYRIMEY